MILNCGMGYCVLEVIDLKCVLQKGDVYSFGVVFFELIIGKVFLNLVMNEEGVDLLRWVKLVVRDEWRREVFDLELFSLEREEEEMMEEMVQLGIECILQYLDQRFEMIEVVRKIESLRWFGFD